MAKHGKNYVEAQARRSTASTSTSPPRPSRCVKELKPAKFDESVEVHVRTGLNVRHADEQLRGTIALPNGLGKDVKIAVFAQGDKAREAEEAGADVVGAEDLAKQIEDGFDRLRRRDRDAGHDAGRRPARPRARARRARCPTRRSARSRWTSRKAVEESKSGKVEYRTDRTAIVHLNIGKTSFDERQLLENYAAVIDEMIRAKPSAAKGRYLRSITHRVDDGPRHQGRPHRRTRDILEERPRAAAA